MQLNVSLQVATLLYQCIGDRVRETAIDLRQYSQFVSLQLESERR